MAGAQRLQVHVRETTDSDLPDILRVQKLAFGQDPEAALTNDILQDPSAKPVVSLMAFHGDDPVGHILFSTARMTRPGGGPSIAILAPLAVVPEAQRQGVGGNLIEAGLRRLSDAGVDLVFVLGHPGYYPRHGFQPAGPFGLDAPHPIPLKHADAWMVRALRPGVIGSIRGKVICSDVLNRPEHWRE